MTRIPKQVPLKLGVGGEVIGSATVELGDDGIANVAVTDIAPEISKKLFGAYSAGGFSIAEIAVKLCFFCATNKCTYGEPTAHFDNCPCCNDGHVV